MSCLAPARTDPGAAVGLARFGPQSRDFSSYLMVADVDKDGVSGAW